MPFVKLDCGIIHSSLWAEDSDTKICWITLLLLADATGFVRAAASAIAREAGISAAAGRRALDLFSSPDDESRTPDNQGKRIEKVDGGYRILNYEKYRERDYTNAERQKRHREKQKRNVTQPLRNGEVTASNTCRSRCRVQKQKEEEPPNPLKGESDGFDLFWKEYPAKQAKLPARKAWLKVDPIERSDVMNGLEAWKRSPSWLKDEGQFIPYPATFLNQRRWEDPPRSAKVAAKARPHYLPPPNEISEEELAANREKIRRLSEELKKRLTPNAA